MITALQTYLSWNLEAETQYQAGSELQATVSFALPSDGSYYLLGALYTPDTQQFIQGTLFGVLVPEGADYGTNDPDRVSVFTGNEGEGLDLLCRFAFGQTDVILGFFFLKMTGEAPNLDVDEEVGVLTTRLVKPAGLDITQLMMPLLLVGMMVPMMGMIGKD